MSAVAQRGSGRPGGGRYGKGKVSASTLAGWYGYKGNLVEWAKRHFFDGALEGKTYAELNERDTDIGSLVHAIIEAEIHGDEWPAIPEDYEQAVSAAYAAWSKWINTHNLTVVATEVACVSDTHGLGGTIDAILQDAEGHYCIGDWKTSAQLRSSYLVQLAVYGLVWEEQNPDKPLTGGYHLLRFSKTNPKNYDHKFFAELNTAREFALHLRRAYEMEKVMRKEAGLAF